MKLLKTSASEGGQPACKPSRRRQRAGSQLPSCYFQGLLGAPGELHHQICRFTSAIEPGTSPNPGKLMLHFRWGVRQAFPFRPRLYYGVWSKNWSAQSKQGRCSGNDRAREEERVHGRYKDHRKLTVELSNGNAVILDPIHLPELVQARRKDLEQVEITPGGIGLHWETLDVDYRIPELVIGVLGPDAWKKQLARYAGQVTSPAKAMAADATGLRVVARPKSGRP